MVEEHDVSGAAPEERSKGEILKSNVDNLATTERAISHSQSPSRVLPLVLAGILLFVLGAGAALFWSQSQTRAQQASARARTSATLAPTQAAAGLLPDINGVSCDALESTIVHIHVHLAIFVNGEEEQVPLGIGIGQPWQVAGSDEGPFVTDGACFYWLHTHTEDGVLHIESPIRRRFTLGDFFAIWQMPLNQTQVGPAQGQVISYVNGQISTTSPEDIPLLPHERIQLDVGADVPPYPFDFPPGD